jgi:hypothetical protein
MELESVGVELNEKEQAKQEFYDTIAKLENKDLLEKVLRSEEWRVMRDVWKDTREMAQHRLNGIDPNDTNEIIRLQIMIDFYDNVLPRSIANYRSLGRDAFTIAKENGWLNKVATYLKLG